MAQVYRGSQDADRYDVPGTVWARRLTVTVHPALLGRVAWAVSRAGARVLTGVCVNVVETGVQVAPAVTVPFDLLHCVQYCRFEEKKSGRLQRWSL